MRGRETFQPPSYSPNILVVYTSTSQHTRTLATAIVDGLVASGAPPDHVKLRDVDECDVRLEFLGWADAVLIGGPVEMGEMTASISAYVDLLSRVGNLLFAAQVHGISSLLYELYPKSLKPARPSSAARRSTLLPSWKDCCSLLDWGGCFCKGRGHCARGKSKAAGVIPATDSNTMTHSFLTMGCPRGFAVHAFAGCGFYNPQIQ